jgi:asparagine synthase (glutamine-hydrolysing)
LDKGGFIGVFGSPDPLASLTAVGVEAVWYNEQLAFAGAPVWSDMTGEIVLSGEIDLDNADELRHRLKMPEAESGTLLLELYRRYGVEAGKMALGMIAVAIWDAGQQRLLLWRDGVGARTLYYAREGRTCWFASRLRTLRQTPLVSGHLSLTALRKYLTFSFVPSSETLWQEVRELRPGTALSWPEEQTYVYWEPVETKWDLSKPIESYAENLRKLLEEAVQVRLPSSGAVGVYLSGGLDSSLVTALTARYAPESVHTYSIYFGDEYPHELKFAEIVAKHCGTRHQELEITPRQIKESLFETMAALDDPIGDPLTVPNFLLGRAAAQDTSLILNGEGADPCFGGPKNQAMILRELYGSAHSRETAYLRSYRKCYQDLPRLLTPQVQEALRDAEPQEALLTPFFTTPQMSSLLNRLMYINTNLKGADHILTKVNNLTTANGLLGRSPLFDRRIVEASFAIPPQYKLDGAIEKAVLKRAVSDLLPDSIINRPKSGMRVPVQGWFKKDLQCFARDLLLSRDAHTRPYFNRQVVRDWLNYEGAIWPRYGAKLWLLLSLEVWLRT